MKKSLLITLIFIFTLSLLLPLVVNAHRSGCHRWHSCPSDRGTYVCGDKGYCSQCPDNKYCKDGKPRQTKDRETDKKSIKQDRNSVTERII